ncbi:MAG: racX [Bacteroidetes bacterium]|nr:racX [Bacteroidota bacterium]
MFIKLSYMRTLGLIGGTSWLSTMDYYRIINTETNRRLSGFSSAQMYLHSVNFADFLPPETEAGWQDLAGRFSQIALKLQQAGADGILLCANTPHYVAPAIRSALSVPLIHIAEATGTEILRTPIRTVGLLGTKFTMEKRFYTDTLGAMGIDTIIPDDEDRIYIHRAIFDEMIPGRFLDTTKNKILEIIARLADRGAEGIIFGCTELPILIKQGTRVPHVII